MELGKYDLFLLDFDGLLVDTEPLHLQAYCLMLKQFGLELPWTMTEYCQVAHISSKYLQQTLNQLFPILKSHDWSELYSKKKRIYLDLISDRPLNLMPGAFSFLKALSSKKHAVVTHSPREQIEMIRKKLPVLESIPHWFTREDYQNPKPAPDGYLHALKTLGADAPIGFEDSVRGYQALEAAHIPAVLVRPDYYPPVEIESHPSLDKLIS